MAKVIWTEPALIDLNKIAEYIALDIPVAARNLVQTIFSKTERLEVFPASGRKPPELINQDIKKSLLTHVVSFIVMKVIMYLYCM